MKSKKLVALITMVFVGASCLCGCGDKKTDADVSAQVTASADSISTQASIASQLETTFVGLAADATDAESIADELISNRTLGELGMVLTIAKEGYLDGFNEEIHGFSEGAKFSPMVGSIPFVGYVFKSENPAELEATLKEHAQLDWNVCTAADEMVVNVSGDYVLFVMAPNTL